MLATFRRKPEIKTTPIDRETAFRELDKLDEQVESQLSDRDSMIVTKQKRFQEAEATAAKHKAEVEQLQYERASFLAAIDRKKAEFNRVIESTYDPSIDEAIEHLEGVLSQLHNQFDFREPVVEVMRHGWPEKVLSETQVCVNKAEIEEKGHRINHAMAQLRSLKTENVADVALEIETILSAV